MDLFAYTDGATATLCAWLQCALPTQILPAVAAMLPVWWCTAEFAHGALALGVHVAVLATLLRAAHAIALHLWPAFRTAARDDNQRWYILVNLCKAACLALMCFSAQWWSDTYDSFIDDQWQLATGERALRAKRIVALYVATDVVALAVVPQLPHTTIVHHYVTTLLALCIFGTDLRTANVARMALLYGALCTTTYLVNALLALRCLYDRHCWTSWLSAAALAIYAVACAINWLWHAVWFAQQLSTAFYVVLSYVSAGALHEALAAALHAATLFQAVTVVAYAYSVAMLVRDDLILMRWLWRRAQRSDWLRSVAHYGMCAHNAVYYAAQVLAEPHRRVYSMSKKVS